LDSPIVNVDVGTGGAALDFEERFEGGAVDDGCRHLPQRRIP
jgi:hypothetical protein